MCFRRAGVRKRRVGPLEMRLRRRCPRKEGWASRVDLAPGMVGESGWDAAAAAVSEEIMSIYLSAAILLGPFCSSHRSSCLPVSGCCSIRR